MDSRRWSPRKIAVFLMVLIASACFTWWFLGPISRDVNREKQAKSQAGAHQAD